MWRCILQREASGSWCLFAPVVVGDGMLLLSFGEAEWDAAGGRWTRPDLHDYENAERTLVIMKGKSALTPTGG